MATPTTLTNRVVCSNASYVHITPWKSEDGFDSTPITYDIKDIVGDSLSFTADDNTVNSKEGEFTDDPLFENITLGKYQFAATCIDFQNTIMEKIFGWTTDTNGNAYAPNGYKDVFATIEIGFRNEDVVLVAPKVKMNSKATFGSFKTGTGEANLAGTAYNTGVKYTPSAGGSAGAEVLTPLALLKKATGAKYTIKSKNFVIGAGYSAS